MNATLIFSQAKTRSGEKSCKEAEIAIIEQHEALEVVLLLFGTIPILRFTLCAQFQKIKNDSPMQGFKFLQGKSWAPNYD